MVFATRFTGLGAGAARALLALMLVLCASLVAVAIQPPVARQQATVDPARTDLALYTRIAERVGEGESYYSAVVSEQRARNYPLRPFVTVRLPTLAWTAGATGPDAAGWLLRLLMAAALAALIVRLRKELASRLVWAAAASVAGASMVLLTVPAMTFWHESWSVLLIVLSLSLRSRSRWGVSVALGLAAVLFRELALPYLGIMALLALRDRNYAEAAAWSAAILIFFAALAAHAHALSALVLADDPVSPGWTSGGGWAFILSMVKLCTSLAVLPRPLVALAVPLALIGWAGLRGSFGERAALLLVLSLAAFMLLGRPDNFYWGLMIAPLLPLGLAFAPSALADLARAAVPRLQTAPAPAE